MTDGQTEAGPADDPVTELPAGVTHRFPERFDEDARRASPSESLGEVNAAAVQSSTEENPAENGSPRIDTPAPFAIRWGMPQKLTWKDTDELAYALIDTFPDQAPLKLSFPKLHKMIIALEDFGDDPEKSTESVLEAIQMAWYEEVK